MQANAIANVLNETLNVPMYASAIGISIVLALAIIGGLKSISNICIKLVPFMAVIYILGCIIILVINSHFILPAILEVLKSAFTARAAGGGFIGAGILTAVRFGVARGLFSNEAGMGSAPIVSAAAKSRNCVRKH